jgi:hypothetical protein
LLCQILDFSQKIKWYEKNDHWYREFERLIVDEQKRGKYDVANALLSYDNIGLLIEDEGPPHYSLRYVYLYYNFEEFDDNIEEGDESCVKNIMPLYFSRDLWRKGCTDDHYTLPLLDGINYLMGEWDDDNPNINNLTLFIDTFFKSMSSIVNKNLVNNLTIQPLKTAFSQFSAWLLSAFIPDSIKNVLSFYQTHPNVECTDEKFSENAEKKHLKILEKILNRSNCLIDSNDHKKKLINCFVDHFIKIYHKTVTNSQNSESKIEALNKLFSSLIMIIEEENAFFKQAKQGVVKQLVKILATKYKENDKKQVLEIINKLLENDSAYEAYPMLFEYMRHSITNEDRNNPNPITLYMILKKYNSSDLDEKEIINSLRYVYNNMNSIPLWNYRPLREKLKRCMNYFKPKNPEQMLAKAYTPKTPAVLLPPINKKYISSCGAIIGKPKSLEQAGLGDGSNSSSLSNNQNSLMTPRK